MNELKNLQKKRGYNLKTTALKAGLSENAIYSWKRYAPSSDKLKAVADVLGVTVDYLLSDTKKSVSAEIKASRH
ncbi:helix-turn-helix domain-containing protein [Lacticaseibacillus pantheris]|uniref:helix-turn-helix domain-containing protein n=1 Tax=Lacticaseibacillus pantheris TaxID=171523 RepID=UPI003F714A0C